MWTPRITTNWVQNLSPIDDSPLKKSDKSVNVAVYEDKCWNSVQITKKCPKYLETAIFF